MNQKLIHHMHHGELCLIDRGKPHRLAQRITA